MAADKSLPKEAPTRRSSEREPADSLRDKSNVIGGWLPSLTFAFGEDKMKKPDILIPRFSLVATVGILLVWSLLLPVVLFFPFTGFAPNLGGHQGFPLAYYTWTDCGPPFSHFLWWNLILDFLFLSALSLGCGVLIERRLVNRLRTAPPATETDARPAFSDTRMVGLAACSFSAAGVILPLLTYDRLCFAPAATVWVCAEVFALLLGTSAWRSALGKTAVASALLLTAVPVMFYLAYPKTFGDVYPESSGKWQAKYDRAIDAQPEPLHSFLNATRPVDSDPNMLACKNAVLKARDSFSPLLTRQMVALIGDEDVLGYTAKDLLEKIYAGDFLVDRSESWRIPDVELKRAMETLIDAMAEARTQEGLVTCLLIFVKATRTETAEVQVPSMNATVRVGFKDGTTSYNYTPSDAWKGRMKEVTPLFQKYCRDRLASLKMNTEQSAAPLPSAPAGPSECAR
jgi:hypothetical protein